MDVGFQRAFFQQTCYLFVTQEQLSFVSQARWDSFFCPFQGGAFGEPQEGCEGSAAWLCRERSRFNPPVQSSWTAPWRGHGCGTSDVPGRESVPKAVWVDNPSLCGGVEERVYDVLT